MKKRNLILSCLVISLFLISFVYAIPLIEFVNPTSNNNSFISNTSIEINSTITESNLGEIIFNWNSSNYTLFDNSLVLMMNFNNVSALEENDTYVKDLSNLKRNNGSVTNASWTSDGKWGGAFHFDGAEDYIDIQDDSSLDIINNITMSSWFRIDKILDDEYTSVIRKGTMNYGMFSSDDGSRSFCGDANGWIRTVERIFIPNKWYYMSCSISGTDVSIYANVRPEPIYTIGDSITAGHGGSSSHCTSNDNCGFSAGQNINHTYQYWLDYYLNSYASAESTTTSYYNKGYGSQTCDAIYSRFDNDIANNSEVILMCGINDLAGASTAEEIQTDIEQIYNLSMQKNNTLVVMEILPDGAGLYCSGITAVNSWLSTFVSSHENISLVNVHDELSNGTECYINSSYFESDNVHPNTAGLKEMARQIWMQHYNSVNYGLALQRTESFATWDGIETTNDGVLTIGAKDDHSSYFFNGTIDEVRIWNKSLSSDEVRENYYSNINKYDADKYLLYVNQSKNSTAGLDEGSYTYQIFVSNSSEDLNQTSERTISIDLNYPQINFVTSNNSALNYNSTFNFNVTDLAIANCSLIIDGSINTTSTGISVNTLQNITSLLPSGEYNWNINCTDNLGRENSSQINKITIIKATEFSGNSTDLSQITDVSNITNFILENPSYGKINFSNSVNLSGGKDIDSYVNISDKSIEINSTALPELNTSAELTFYGITYTDPGILKDGVTCSSTICQEVSYSANIYTVNVTGFSTYTVTETYSAPTTEEETTSSSSGGGLPIYYPTESNLQEGYSKILGKNWRLRFNFENETHELKIDDIQNTSTTITISSNPITFNLSINQTKKIDLGDNGFYDFSVLLKNITGNSYYRRAEVYIKSINEEIQNQSNTTNEENNLNEENNQNKEIKNTISENIKDNKFILGIIGIILIAIVITLLILKFKKKKKRK